MAPPQPGDPGSTATGQAQVRQLIDGCADRLKANGAIRSSAVERAVRTVPRHRLLETFFHRPIDAADFTTVDHDPARPRPEDLTLIYSDTALGTRLVEQFGALMPASSTSSRRWSPTCWSCSSSRLASRSWRSGRAPATTPPSFPSWSAISAW